MTKLLLLSTLVLATGCQTTLRQVRDLPPSLVLAGPTVGVEVTGQFREAALEQLELGLARHAQPVRCESGAACQASTVVHAKIVDTSVTPRLAGPNLVRAMTDVIVQATVDIDAVNAAGQQLSSKRYFGSITGNVLSTPVESLKAQAVQIAARRFLRKLLPRTLDIELAVETGGDLEPGVERALAGDLAGAEAEFKRLTESRPDHADAWYDLGVIRELQGNEDLALDAYKRAVGLSDRASWRQAVHQLEQRMN